MKTLRKAVRYLGGALMGLIITAPVSLVAAQQSWPGSQYFSLPLNWGAIIMGFLFVIFYYWSEKNKGREPSGTTMLILLIAGGLFGQFVFSGILPNVGFSAVAPAPSPTPAPAPSPTPAPAPSEVTGTIQVYVKNWLTGSVITSNVIGFLVTPDIWNKYGGDALKIVSDKKLGLLNVPTASVDSNGILKFCLLYTSPSPRD